jgi:hypothetical protein
MAIACRDVKSALCTRVDRIAISRSGTLRPAFHMRPVSAVAARRQCGRVVLTVVGNVVAPDVSLDGSFEILSTPRLCVAGESLWAKGQKDWIAAVHEGLHRDAS